MLFSVIQNVQKQKTDSKFLSFFEQMAKMSLQKEKSSS